MLQYDWMEIQKYGFKNVVWYCGSVGSLRKDFYGLICIRELINAVMEIYGAEPEDKVTEPRNTNKKIVLHENTDAN